LFDQNDVPTKLVVKGEEEETKNHNIGTKEEPKMVKLSKQLHAN